jgi:hypothetical protein
MWRAYLHPREIRKVLIKIEAATALQSDEDSEKV